MAFRIPGVGRVCVSLYRLIGMFREASVDRPRNLTTLAVWSRPGLGSRSGITGPFVGMWYRDWAGLSSPAKALHRAALPEIDGDWQRV